MSWSSALNPLLYSLHCCPWKYSAVLFPVVIQGVTCILPVLREGVLTGSPEQKEEAAKALGAVIKLTSAEALRPSVVNITGPLIRILGDRFAWTVKTALLETLTLLLAKVCSSISAPDTGFNQSLEVFLKLHPCCHGRLFIAGILLQVMLVDCMIVV